MNFAVVVHIHYLDKQQQYVCTDHLFKWKGGLSQSGHPLFIDWDSWQEA